MLLPTPVNGVNTRTVVPAGVRTVALCALAIVLAHPSPRAQAAQQRAEAQSPETIELLRGRSQHVTAPWQVMGASLTDADVADVQVLTPELLLVSGKSVGSTDLLVWGEGGRTRSWQVSVRTDLEALHQELSRLFPDARLELSQSHDVTVVSGILPRAEQAQQMHAWLDGLELNFVDMTSLAGVQQVQLKVRMAEVSRTAIRALGINALGGGDDFFFGSTIGPAGGGPIQPVNIGPPENASALGNVPFEFNSDVNVSPGVTLFAGFPNSDLQIFVQALADDQYLRILAEPNLVALSGEQAKFLAGGEIPIPVVQGSTSGAGTSISIEYKPFGIGLQFKPIVLGDGAIRLQIASEVSDLTDVGSVQIEGFKIPALVTRKAETTLEMKSGQTFAMAGLLSASTNAQSSRVPGLGDLPLIGALFRSVRYRGGDTELILLVTAVLVEPLSETVLPPLPGEEHVSPSDWELYGESRLEGRPPPRTTQEDATWFKKHGFHRLKGPGAWATHEHGPAHSRAKPNQRNAAASSSAAAPQSGDPAPTAQD